MTKCAVFVSQIYLSNSEIWVQILTLYQLIIAGNAKQHKAQVIKYWLLIITSSAKQHKAQVIKYCWSSLVVQSNTKPQVLVDKYVQWLFSRFI